MNTSIDFDRAFAACPLVAILRGVRHEEAKAVVAAIVHHGWTLIEVPLNSPAPLHSIAVLSAAYPQALVGAGTVLSVEQVHEVHEAGGRVIVSPNFNPAVVRAAVDLGLACLPGVATASEAFAALDAGATGLKLFPAEMIPPAAVKALRAVLPTEALLLPVGGITQANMADYRAAGADGFGIGSALFKPGLSPEETGTRAADFKAAWDGTMRA
jgi:2-dehydro-3-deoxyphosphogalactonate aldolase